MRNTLQKRVASMSSIKTIRCNVNRLVEFHKFVSNFTVCLNTFGNSSVLVFERNSPVWPSQIPLFIADRIDFHRKYPAWEGKYDWRRRTRWGRGKIRWPIDDPPLLGYDLPLRPALPIYWYPLSEMIRISCVSHLISRASFIFLPFDDHNETAFQNVWNINWFFDLEFKIRGGGFK